MSPKLAQFLAALLLWSLAGCGGRDSVKEELHTLQKLITPEAANVTEQAEFAQNSSGASATWQFEAELDWEKYSQWVSKRLPTQYKATVGGPTTLHFRHSQEGDVYTLVIEKVASSPALRVRVHFRALAN